MFKKKLINNIEEWLKNKKISCKKSTYTNYEYIIKKRIISKIGNLKKKDINNKFINNYTLELINSGLSKKTIKDTLSILYQILKYSNINIKITYPKIYPNQIQILEINDQKKLEKYLKENMNERNIGIYLSLYTGLRIGEVCALKWQNIDFNKKIIYIKNTLIRVKNEEHNKKKTRVILDSPKSYNGIREIPIPDFIFAYLRQYKTNNDYFIISNKKSFIEPRNYLKYYKKILTELNINKYNYHALRHTFATRCIELGSDPKTLSELLGHSNIKITLDRYVHPNMENKKKLINKIKPNI